MDLLAFRRRHLRKGLDSDSSSGDGSSENSSDSTTANRNNDEDTSISNLSARLNGIGQELVESIDCSYESESRPLSRWTDTSGISGVVLYLEPEDPSALPQPGILIQPRGPKRFSEWEHIIREQPYLREEKRTDLFEYVTQILRTPGNDGHHSPPEVETDQPWARYHRARTAMEKWNAHIPAQVVRKHFAQNPLEMYEPVMNRIQQIKRLQVKPQYAQRLATLEAYWNDAKTRSNQAKSALIAKNWREVSWLIHSTSLDLGMKEISEDLKTDGLKECEPLAKELDMSRLFFMTQNLICQNQREKKASPVQLLEKYEQCRRNFQDEMETELENIEQHETAITAMLALTQRNMQDVKELARTTERPSREPANTQRNEQEPYLLRDRDRLTAVLDTVANLGTVRDISATVKEHVGRISGSLERVENPMRELLGVLYDNNLSLELGARGGWRWR